MDMTKTYNTEEFNQAYILDNLKEISKILKEKGYQPTNQIVGYLLSGDPGYITSFKNARSKMVEMERTKILEALIQNVI